MLSIVLMAFVYLPLLLRWTFGEDSSMSDPPSTARPAEEHLVVVVVVVAPTALELARSGILIWVVLVSILAADVVLVVHVGSIFFGLVVSTLAVPFVHA